MTGIIQMKDYCCFALHTQLGCCWTPVIVSRLLERNIGTLGSGLTYSHYSCGQHSIWQRIINNFCSHCIGKMMFYLLKLVLDLAHDLQSKCFSEDQVNMMIILQLCWVQQRPHHEHHDMSLKEGRAYEKNEGIGRFLRHVAHRQCQQINRGTLVLNEQMLHSF